MNLKPRGIKPDFRINRFNGMELKTGENDEGRRLDRVLRKALSGCSLSLIHRLLRQGRVLVDGEPAAPSRRVKAGAIITVDAAIPRTQETARRPAASSHPAALPPILWQGGGLIVFNKPAGLAVHGPGGLDGMARAFLAPSLSPSLSFRPGPLHRLDKPTSGIIVFSTCIEGARRFSALLREHRLKKYYLALVEGRVEKEALWRDELFRDRDAKKTFTAEPGEGKTALTKISPLALTPPDAGEACTLLLAEIVTGRTHQVRAQAAARGHPLAGDRKYGARGLRYGKRGLSLHAWKLELCETSPELSVETFPPSITAPPPEAFLDRIRTLFGGAPADGFYLSNHLPLGD
jgi:23S rRNA pseudouridine955/2504/2580 synthase